MSQPRVAHVIFSTNRLEYLEPTLTSTQQLDWSGCQVDRWFWDDYPQGRDDQHITQLAASHGFDRVCLHSENQGLSVTWSECWNELKRHNYDYVFHQEDDVVILAPVSIIALANYLTISPRVSQIQLARQSWYFHEQDPEPLHSDINYFGLRLNQGTAQFSPMASLCPGWVLNVDYGKYIDCNLNEGLIATVLAHEYGAGALTAKSGSGSNLVQHIGEWFIGRRVLPGEPNSEQFARFDPQKRYYSKDGADYHE
jgi:hypothetical protein